jgi:hypothetical protein
MSTVNKYWDKYRERHRAESVEKPDVARLMTDKQAYISFLEVQLERVTQSVLTTQGFSDRIESLQGQITSADEKIVNLTRLVKLQQTYAESQEEEISRLKKSLDSSLDGKQNLTAVLTLERRLQALEDKSELSKLREKEPKHDDFMKEVDLALKNTESKIASLLEKFSDDIENKQKRHQKSVEASIELCSAQLQDNYKELNQKVQGLKTDPGEGKAKWRPPRETEGDWKQPKTDNAEKIVERLEGCERGLRDLEQFLVAVAEEVKTVEERQTDTSDLEIRISEKLNAKVERLAEVVRKSLKISEEGPKKITQTPEKIQEQVFCKESPKFPSVASSNSKPRRPPEKLRSKSKDSEKSIDRSASQQKSNSRERSKERSKSPKSITSRSNKSSSSNHTPKAAKPKLSRTPKSKKRSGPGDTPPRREKSISPSETPKGTSKSKAMEANIKQKIKQIKSKEHEEKGKEDKRKTKKRTDNKTKLDKLYQELSGKN